jgi:hypothetical protein
MISVTATVNGENVTIINILIDGINISIVYIDSNNDVKIHKTMYVPGIIIATGATIV